MDLGHEREPVETNLKHPAEATWIQPVPDQNWCSRAADPGGVDVGAERRSGSAFIAALDQQPPPKQRAARSLCEGVHWQAYEQPSLSQARRSGEQPDAAGTAPKLQHHRDAAERRGRCR